MYFCDVKFINLRQMITRHAQIKRRSALQSLEYSQLDIEQLLELSRCQQDNLLNYLYQTNPLSLDLSTSPLKYFLQPQVTSNESYELIYTHEADKKYVLFNFLFEFFNEESNKMFEVLLVESLQTVSTEELAIYLEGKVGGRDKGREAVAEWITRVKSLVLLSKIEQKVTTLALPFIIENNRRIKAIVFTDVNAFDYDHRSRFIEKLERDLRELKLLVILFRKDYQAGKDSLIYEQIIDDMPIKKACERLSKMLTAKHNNLFLRYVAPVQEYGARTQKKMDVFRSILFTDNLPDDTTLKLITYSTRPWEMRDQLIGKARGDEPTANRNSGGLQT